MLKIPEIGTQKMKKFMNCDWNNKFKTIKIIFFMCLLNKSSKKKIQ